MLGNALYSTTWVAVSEEGFHLPSTFSPVVRETINKWPPFKTSGGHLLWMQYCNMGLIFNSYIRKMYPLEFEEYNYILITMYFDSVDHSICNIFC